MSNVERRIVEMRFDNKDFEKNINSTLISLDTLDKALRMQGGINGLKSITAAANNVDLSGLEYGVNTIADRFSALGIIGMRVLQNITDRAMAMAGSLANTFFGPLFSGGKSRAMNMAQARFMFEGFKYTEEQIGAVGERGTIMDNIYKSVEGTFYSLDKAALNASHFLATGMDVSDLTVNLRAVAGVASMFGADYQRVGDIFAKVRTQGKLMGQDLMSLNSYGVPTIAKITEYLNNEAKAAKYTQEQVSEMVSKGEIDFEIFAGAMYDAFGAQAAKSKKLFTGAIEDMGAAMARIGEKGWAPLLNLGRDFFNATVPLIDSVNGKLGPFFEKYTVYIDNFREKLAHGIDMLSAFLNFNETLTQLTPLSAEGMEIVSKDRVNALERIRKAAALLYFDEQAHATGINKMNEYREALTKFLNGDGKYDPETLEKAETALTMFNEAMKNGKVPIDIFWRAMGFTSEEVEHFKDILEGLKAILDLIKMPFTALKDALSDSGSTARKVLDVFLAFFAMIGRGIVKIRDFAKEHDGMAKAGELISKAFDKLGQAIDFISNKIGSIGDVFSWLKGILVSIYEFIKPILDPLIERVKEFFSYIKEGMQGLNLESGAKLAGGGLLGFGLLKLYQTFVNLKKKFQGNGAGGLLFGPMFDNFNSTLDKLQETLAKWQERIKSGDLFQIAKAILMLAAAFLVVSLIPEEKLAGATIAIGELFAALVIASNNIDKVKGRDISGVTRIAAAVLILSFAFKALAGVENYEQGLLATASLLGILVSVMAILSKLDISDGKSLRQACTGMIMLAAALWLMSKPVKDLAGLSDEELMRGLGGITGLLLDVIAYMGVFASLSDKAGGIVQASLGVIALAVGLMLLTKPVKELAGLSWDEIGRGLGSLFIILVSLGSFMAGMAATKMSGWNAIGFGASLILIAAAMRIMVGPMKEFGSMNAKQIGLAFGVLGGVLLSIFVFMDNMTKIDPLKMLAVSASLVVIAGVLYAITGVIALMGSMENSAKGLGILAGALLAMAVTMKMMSDVTLGGIGGILAIAAAIAIIVPALMLLSMIPAEGITVGLIALAGALVIFIGAAYLAEGAALGMLALAGAIALFGAGILMLGTGLTLVSTGLLLLCQTIIKFGSTVGDALLAVIKYIPEFIRAFLRGVSECIPDIVDAGLSILKNFLKGILNNLGEIVETTALIIITFLDNVAYYIPEIVKAGFKLLAQFIDGMSQGLTTYGPVIMYELGDLILALLEMLADVLLSPIFGDKAVEAVQGWREGLRSKIDDAKQAAGMVGDATEESLDIENDMHDIGKQSTMGFANGLRAEKVEAYKAGYDVAGEAEKGFKYRLAISSPSRKMFELGEFTTKGLILGIKSLDSEVRKTASNLGSSIEESVSGSFSKIPAIAGTIAPMFDMSYLANGVDIRTSGSVEAELQDKLMYKLEEFFKRFNDKQVDPDIMYEAVRAGASDATIGVRLNSRELGRGLNEMGVSFR